MATFRRGELSIDQAYEVAAKAPAWADAKLTEFATVATVRQLRRMIRDENFEGNPDEPEPDAKKTQQPIAITWDEHGQLRIPGALDTEQGMIVSDDASEAKDFLIRSGHANVTWTDTIAEIARRSLADQSSERRERFKAYVHVHTDSGAVQLTNGVPLPPAWPTTCCATPTSNRCGNTTTSHSVPDAANATSPTARDASSNTTTKAAASPAAPIDNSRSTTSGTA